MSQQELLKKVLGALNAHDFPYMLTGSIVSSIQGEPRLSHDIDVIIARTFRIFNILREHFDEKEYYFDSTAAKEAIASQQMFNLIDIIHSDINNC
jgi:SPX domain protein involved in polyphosphate accumulation